MLSAEDNLLQVCLHTAKHSYVRAPGLRLHCDVDRIVRYTTLDWARFTGTVEALRVKTAVYYSLAIPAKFLSTPVPASVLNQLCPPPRKHRVIWRMILSAGLFHPHQPKFTNTDYIRFTALLYDTPGDLARAVFPDHNWMKRRYRFSSPALLPVYHARRWWDLVFRRTGI